ncbi:MAG: electron transport complex subunit RsxC [Lachnospiraceae bacterium]|nr:electron transport complex subunit RsxC [Lachnospiraceae bacterium]MDD3614954.1 electron transport complex subunit RsxC [Lachnospiraceae bacterium]
MSLLTFKGGIHPDDGKKLSKEKPIKSVLPKGELVYLLSQHIGAPAKPIVQKGDHVLVGQKIAEAGGFVSAPVYSTVSGTVKSLEKRMNVTGAMGDAIIVENDNNYETVTYQPLKSLKDVSKEEVLNRIKEAGVVGMGGAGFPTHVKLSPKEPDKIEFVIVNGAECEPYLTSDYRRMLEEPEKIIGGLKCMLHLFDNARGYIAIEDNKPDCIARMTELVEKEDRIEVKTLKTKYPQGAERQLIYATTNRSINSSMLPADAGCVVDNVDTVVAIYNGVRLGRPLMHRIVTVTGDAITDPRNFLVPVGTNYEELIEEAGGFKQDPVKIISGGPMMGFGLYDLNVPVTKTSSALLCLTSDDVSENEETNCINCGKCVSVCPGRVLPARLATFANEGKEEAFLKYNGMECCECGCCSFVCPAKRPLTQSIKSMRRMILANRKKKA